MKKLYFLALSLITMSLFSENLNDDEFNQATNKHCVEVAEKQDRVGGPPLPPKGKRWVRNEMLSDEFNGTELDTTKWLDNHPTWKGREPGLFMSSQVSVKDGCLQIKGEKMEKDTVVHAYNRDLTFNIKGGAVVSKNTAYQGYFECRAKAAATTMSTTFWFSTGKSSAGPKGCDSYGLEWDIQECIGRTGDFKGSYFAKGMHSNSHYWYTDCDGEKHDYRAKQVIFDDEELASDDFHVYGGWWRDESSASYYYDNNEPKHQTFYDEVSKEPFDKPMYMRLVHETYPFPWIELPTDEELADSTKNTVYYDWVRSYMLVDADDPYEEFKAAPIVELYVEDVAIDKSDAPTIVGQNIHIPFTYRANDNREIYFTLRNSKGEIVATDVLTAYAGYANTDHSFELDEKYDALKNFTLHADIRPIGGSENQIINSDVHKCTE